MKIKSLIYTTLAASLLFASCDLNKQPVFDDNTQAYIAFEGASAIVKEAVDGVPGMLEVKLHCASVEGINAEVSFEAVDTAYAEALRAKVGEAFTFVGAEVYNEDTQENRSNVQTVDLTAGNVIKFDADHRFASIYVQTIDNNQQGGDKKFDLVLNNVKGCNLGAHSTFAVTIADDEDPMNMLVGTYAATAASAFQGYPDESWEVTITRDDEAADKIWIHPICMFGGLSASSIYPVYAVVDVARGTIAMPYSQCVYGGEGQSYNMVIAGTGNTPVLSGAGIANFEMVDGTVTISFNEGIGVGNIAADEWWYQALQAPTMVKK